MNDEQPTTAPGFNSLPIAPATAAPAPLRGAWSLRRRAATAIAAIALVGTGGAVAGSLSNGTDPTGVATPPAPTQTGAAGHGNAGDTVRHPSTEHESDEA